MMAERWDTPNIVSFGQSDIGLKRSNNEDAFIVRPEKGFFAVADGMGGEAAGEVASQLFIQTVIEVFSQIDCSSEGDIYQLVQESFRLANQYILSRAKINLQEQGMGCTAELIAFDNQNFVLGHVGDSRTYILRQGKLQQLSHDHSLVQDQIDQGLITPAESRKHTLRNIILKAVGANEILVTDLVRGKWFPGDLFLLCSDGLTDLVDDAYIQEALLIPISLPQRVERLIHLAKSKGGYDNITVVLCEIGIS
jgi:protein phosphatase